MRVLFIQNNGIQESIGVANLSGILKANGHETDLLLVSHTPNLIDAIKQYDPGLIAFSALTGVHHSIERLAISIKQQLHVPIIVGGPHPTYSPELIERPGIDIICRGEGEHGLGVGVRPHGRARHDEGRARVLGLREHAEGQPELGGGAGAHPGELATADDADDGKASGRAARGGHRARISTPVRG